MNNLLSIYIHIPFCRTRCGYCDFNTYAGYDHLRDKYVKSVVKEIAKVSEKVSRRYLVHTIYFGGGTPSLLSPSQFENIIKTILDHFSVASKIEISTEANPTSLSFDYLKSLRNIGVNRLSLGMQSASKKDLEILGRRHSFKDVVTCVENARNAGFSNINLDLIFGIPHQTLKSFEATLNSAINLTPNHLSLYSLTVEESTPLAIQIMNKSLPEPDSDLAADMYILAMELLEKKGFSQYEISNWAQNEKSRCLHNLQYWRNQEYLGFGAGAHSFFGHSRWENIKTITEYIDFEAKNPQNENYLSPAAINLILLSEKDELSETMMMSMRLTSEGINEDQFFRRFKIKLEDVYSREIAKLINRGLIEWAAIGGHRHLKLTKKGRLLGNQVFMEFISV